MDLGAIGPWGAGLLVAISGLLGVLFKRGLDKQNARDAREKARADREATERKEQADREAAQRKARDDLEAKRFQDIFDQTQEDLTGTRAQLSVMQENMAGLQREVNTARADLRDMWSKMANVQRQLDAAEAHIADVERWDRGGRVGLMPVRVIP